MHDDLIEVSEKKHTKASRFEQLRVKWKTLGKWRWVVVMVGVLLLGGIVTAFALRQNSQFSLTKNKTDDTVSLDISEPEKPSNKELPLDGSVVTEEEYDRVMKYLPMAVMIENLSTIRPVTGLTRADVVFEAVVEGGITRYMAVFHRHEADEIMPVRSARSYYMDWLPELDATYMHIGGAVSTDPRANALPRIPAEGFKSYSNQSSVWFRKSDRQAPHNAFTSTQRMKEVQDRLGWARNPQIQAWQFKDEAVAEVRPTTEKVIDVRWAGSTGGYFVHWVYSPTSNAYIYEVGGARQTDPLTQEAVTAKNVIVQFTNVTRASDNSGRLVYDTVGSGRALIFRDGVTTEGTWKKTELSTRTRFFDAESHEIQFNRGRTWIQVAPNNSEVVY